MEKENESILNRRWREKDGVIYFSVTSDETTGEQWVDRITAKRSFDEQWMDCVTAKNSLTWIGDHAKRILCSADFKPTNGVTTKIAVLKDILVKDVDRTTEKICAEAVLRNLTKPNPEVACLILKMFTHQEMKAMGLTSIVVMHEPIKDSCDDDLSLLTIKDDCYGFWLHSNLGRPGDWWGRGNGFAFAVSQSRLNAYY